MWNVICVHSAVKVSTIPSIWKDILVLTQVSTPSHSLMQMFTGSFLQYLPVNISCLFFTGLRLICDEWQLFRIRFDVAMVLIVFAPRMWLPLYKSVLVKNTINDGRFLNRRVSWENLKYIVEFCSISLLFRSGRVHLLILKDLTSAVGCQLGKRM